MRGKLIAVVCLVAAPLVLVATAAADQSFHTSHADVHAIAHDLRGVVEQKLLALWEPWHDDPDAVVAMAAAGDRRVAGERAVPLPRMSERGTLAIEKDVGAAGKGDAGANRTPRSSSAAFRQRSTPLS